MQIITLTTDLGSTDHYVAAIKGTILCNAPNVTIVDISHQVTAFSILQASYFVSNCFLDFPEGTIHLIGVNSEPIIHLSQDELSSYPSILKFKGHYFVSTDNGFFSLLTLNEPHEGFWRIDDVLSNPNLFKFPSKNLLVPAACKLANKVPISSFASENTVFLRKLRLHPVMEEYQLKGSIIHIDHFGNIITNITKSLFYDFGKNEKFILYFRKKEYSINEISSSYQDVPKGEKVALFNSNNYLEIAINHGSRDRNNGASNLLGIGINDTIRVEFQPKGSVNSLEELF
jgi:S-adenosylmethionine hydrolase